MGRLSSLSQLAARWRRVRWLCALLKDGGVVCSFNGAGQEGGDALLPGEQLEMRKRISGRIRNIIFMTFLIMS